MTELRATLIERWASSPWKEIRADLLENICGKNRPEEFMARVRAGHELFQTGDLRGIDLSGEDIPYARLFEAQLDFANFKRARIYNSSLQSASLNAAVFDGAVLELCSFDMSSARSASFVGTCITQCSFTESDLTDARFEDSTINSCNFAAAKLNGINVERAKILDSLIRRPQYP